MSQGMQGAQCRVTTQQATAYGIVTMVAFYEQVFGSKCVIWPWVADDSFFPHSSKVTSCLSLSAYPSHLVLGLLTSTVLDFCKSHGSNTDRLLLPPTFTIATQLPVRLKSDV